MIAEGISAISEKSVSMLRTHIEVRKELLKTATVDKKLACCGTRLYQIELGTIQGLAVNHVVALEHSIHWNSFDNATVLVKQRTFH